VLHYWIVAGEEEVLPRLVLLVLCSAGTREAMKC